MKILLVAASLGGGYTATVGKIVEQLGDVFDFSLVTFTQAGVSQFERQFGKYLKSLYVLQRQGKFDMHFLLRFSALCKEINPDAVKSFDFASNAYTWWSVGLKGIPWVARIPGIETYFHRWRSLVGRLTFQRAHVVVVASQAVKRKILEHSLVPEHKICVIPNAMTIPAHRRPPELQASDGKVYLGYVAGFYSESKGHRYAIESLRYLSEHYCLLLIGDGKLRPAMEQLSKDLGIEKRVSFLGQLGREEVLKTLLSMQAMVFPSLGEAFGWAIVEAMSVGLPVIASDADGINEIVRDGVNGYLFPPKDPDLLAEAVQKLFSDDLNYKQLCENARETVRTSFGNERLKRDYINLFSKIQ